MTRTHAVSFLGLIVATGLALADDGKLSLTTDKPIYPWGEKSGDPVTLSVKNDTSQHLTLYPTSHWEVTQGGEYIFGPDQLKTYFTSLAPGQSRTWTWDKKNKGESFAKPGSYTLRVFLSFVNSDLEVNLIRTIALTASGKLAGTSLYPLSVGNEAVYHPLNALLGPEKMTVAQKTGSWYKVSNLFGDSSLVKLKGSILTGMTGNGVIEFHFGKKANHTYLTGGPSAFTMKVGAVAETVDTPAGRFEGCYRLDYTSNDGKRKGSFWFASGVGLVQYRHAIYPTGGETYSLHRAKIHGGDQKWYTIGLK